MNRGFDPAQNAFGYGQGLEMNSYQDPRMLGRGAFGKPSFGYGGMRRMPALGMMQQAAVGPTAAAAQTQAG